MRVLMAQVVRFAIVGIVGFCVDAGALYVLVLQGASPYLARLVSFPLAVTATWFLNAYWTFASGRRATRVAGQYGRYLGVQTLGALSNYACYLLVLPRLPQAPVDAVLALAIGSAVGLIVNFAGARWLVFRHKRETVL